MLRLPAALILLLAATWAAAQSEYRLDASGRWVGQQAVPVDADAATIMEARRLLADGHPGRAKSILEKWIKEHETSRSPLLPQAYLLKGDATLADGNEFDALYDYETVCLQYPGSEEFVTALERELDIATRYINGMRRKWLGMRIARADFIGEELLARVQERLPGSRIAEQACLSLADYYYRTRDLKMAAEAYEIFATNFPRSEHAQKARQRRIQANVARFQGPSYDASSLTDARILIEDYARDDPAGARRAGLSDALVARIDESAAAQMLERARWYLRRGDPVSARYTFRRLVVSHPRTVAAGAALQILDERGWSVADARPAAPAPGEQDAAPPDSMAPAEADAPAADAPADSEPSPPAPPEPEP